MGKSCEKAKIILRTKFYVATAAFVKIKAVGVVNNVSKEGSACVFTVSQSKERITLLEGS